MGVLVGVGVYWECWCVGMLVRVGVRAGVLVCWCVLVGVLVCWYAGGRGLITLKGTSKNG